MVKTFLENTNSQVQISVIIPAFNAERVISRSVNSIIKAIKNHSFEIIIVNDGSSDNTEKVCLSLINEYLQCKYYSKENGGATSARKYGVSKANGDYIVFCDADDAYFPGSIDNLVKEAVKNNLDIVVGTSLNTTLDGSYKFLVLNKIEGIFNEVDYINGLLDGLIIAGPACRLIKKHLFNESTFNLSKNIIALEDLYMNVALSYYAKRIGVFNSLLVYNYNVEHMQGEGCKRVMTETALIELYSKIRSIINNLNCFASYQNFASNNLIAFRLRRYWVVNNSKQLLNIIFRNGDNIKECHNHKLLYYSLFFTIIQPFFKLSVISKSFLRKIFSFVKIWN